MRGCLSFSLTPPTPSGWIPGCWSWHEAGWTWDFVCWKISDYSFNLCACDGSDKIFYFFLVQFLESCTFLRICLFLPSCPFYWHIIADSSFLWSFVFLCGLLWSLHFHFWFYWFDFSPFVSWWVWLMVCQFYLSSQRTSFWLCWL